MQEVNSPADSDSSGEHCLRCYSGAGFVFNDWSCHPKVIRKVYFAGGVTFATRQRHDG